MLDLSIWVLPRWRSQKVCESAATIALSRQSSCNSDLIFASEVNMDGAVAAIEERQAQALNDLVNRPKRIDTGSVADNVNSLWSLYHLVPSRNYRSYSIELRSPNGRNLVLRSLL